MESRYSQYDGNGGSSSNDSNTSANGAEERKFTIAPYSEINGVITSIFSADSPYGKTAGVSWEDATLVDGVVYENPGNNSFKVFGWQDVIGRPVVDLVADGKDIHASDAQEYLPKTYASNDITYELVKARVPEYTDGGETLVEPSAIVMEDGEKVEVDPDEVSMPNLIMWLSCGENGPSSASKTLLKNLTNAGKGAIGDLEDEDNWVELNDSSNDLRDDLAGRKLRLFKVKRESDQTGRTFYHPIVEDVALGEQVLPKNGSGGAETADTEPAPSSPQNDSVEEGFPAPIDDFVTNATQLSLDEDGANNLLEDMISSNNDLTEAMVDQNGGRETIVQEAI